uniref:Uncharacterized protein n=1 Tax=Setaria viridis TaxID=4556 RepID=A0A4U6TTW0_SETVI|nr:hypothetical protein SEVIR_7G224050v2 [Setaria viridis]
MGGEKRKKINRKKRKKEKENERVLWVFHLI